jgi:hypothetical protein
MSAADSTPRTRLTFAVRVTLPKDATVNPANLAMYAHEMALAIERLRGYKGQRVSVCLEGADL